MALVHCPVCDEMFDTWSAEDFEGCCFPRCLRIYRARCEETHEKNERLDAEWRERQKKKIKSCTVCGAKFFDKTRTNVKRLCPTCEMEKSLGLLSLARMQDDGPLTARQLMQVEADIRAQDLWRRSAWWTKAMHAYARQRYVNSNGLFYRVSKRKGDPLEQMANKILAAYDKVGY